MECDGVMVAVVVVVVAVVVVVVVVSGGGGGWRWWLECGRAGWADDGLSRVWFRVLAREERGRVGGAGWGGSAQGGVEVG